MSDPIRDAALRVLAEEHGGPLHWTVIMDLALTRGYLDPFTQPELRKHVLAALAQAATEGAVLKPAKGTFALP